jgi:hypothetical protein
MAVKVRGFAQSKANMDRLIGDITGRKIVRAIQSALIIGGSQAALYTPIDTSTLINSQFRELVIDGHLVTGRIGYSASYALSVHDPNIRQKFRRATAEKEFLKKGFEDMRGQIDTVVMKELSS